MIQPYIEIYKEGDFPVFQSQWEEIFQLVELDQLSGVIISKDKADWTYFLLKTRTNYPWGFIAFNNKRLYDSYIGYSQQGLLANCSLYKNKIAEMLSNLTECSK